MTIIERYDEALDSAFDTKLDEILAAHQMYFAVGGASAQSGGAVKEYQTVGPEARHKLKGILKYYAKKAHPFEACVRDNRKRFGARAEAVCATLKDIIWNTTKWRGKGNPAGRGPHSYVGASEDAPEIDEQTAQLIEQLSELELWDLMGAVVLDEDSNEIQLKEYSVKQRRELAAKGHALPDGSYPIADKADLHNAIQAIGRAKNPLRVKKHIVRRARALGAHDMVPSQWKSDTAHMADYYDSPGMPGQDSQGMSPGMQLTQDDKVFLTGIKRSIQNELRESAAFLATDPTSEAGRIASCVLNNRTSELRYIDDMMRGVAPEHQIPPTEESYS